MDKNQKSFTLKIKKKEFSGENKENVHIFPPPWVLHTYILAMNLVPGLFLCPCWKLILKLSWANNICRSFVPDLNTNCSIKFNSRKNCFCVVLLWHSIALGGSLAQSMVNDEEWFKTLNLCDLSWSEHWVLVGIIHLSNGIRWFPSGEIEI